jgi:hypothetical protein
MAAVASYCSPGRHELPLFIAVAGTGTSGGFVIHPEAQEAIGRATSRRNAPARGKGSGHRRVAVVDATASSMISRIRADLRPAPQLPLVRCQ